jgi:DNA-binding CsgD family transcriptional regulator
MSRKHPEESRILDLLKQGHRPPQIIEQVDVCIETVYRIRRDAGIPGRPGRPHSDATEWVKHLIGQNLSRQLIAKKTGVSLSTITDIKKSMGLAELRRKRTVAQLPPILDMAEVDLRAAVWKQLALNIPHSAIEETNNCTVEEVVKLEAELRQVLRGKPLCEWFRLKDRPRKNQVGAA